MKSIQEYLAEADNNTTHYLVKMCKSGDDQHFVVDYPTGPDREGHPLALRRTIDQDDRTEEFLAQGYSRPKVIAQWSGDIDDNIKAYRARAESWADLKSEYPTQYYDSLRKAEELERAKSILNGTVEEGDSTVHEHNAMLKLSGLVR